MNTIRAYAGSGCKQTYMPQGNYCHETGT